MGSSAVWAAKLHICGLLRVGGCGISGWCATWGVGFFVSCTNQIFRGHRSSRVLVVCRAGIAGRFWGVCRADLYCDFTLSPTTLKRFLGAPGPEILHALLKSHN